MAPLLAGQGIYTRAVTPRLPEPQGDRSGRAGNGPPLRLLIAGDSAAAGVGVADQRDALAGQLAASLSPHFDVRWRLVAQTGYTTRDLLTRLEQEGPQPFDVAVLSLGVNDVTGAVRTATWLARQQRLAALLVRRFRVRHVLLSSVPPMHEMRALPQPLRRVLGARARHFNAALAAAVRDWPNCEVLSVALPLHPDALASDGFHPGELAYRHWANQLAARIRARIAISGTDSGKSTRRSGTSTTSGRRNSARAR
ncbi:SGNH/GDSL hydrolase family protein [Burkholderia sp. Bp9125]|nr:SGNH/GDSL hydrolase family protein [Burkholderia sp. Bp9125]